ncbi:hypothetical protein G9403_02415 [Weissella paramesenteroides]|uniref:Uncharacterized protein n=1 Tax=Weissella paramesenteroides TaxID=1249 RepID=A0ABD4XH78_WEIPA|nr:hypothetical protein [Weissella paramesenteroides]MDF8368294.1 hypothetical protein [Weissella paramesenteroides]MDF8370517.1 hypothetical protein [Weissella paramesenteroides]
MAIAGVKPFRINYLDDDVFIENAWDEPEAEIHSGFPETFVGYTETQVREILIKLLNSKNAMRRDMTAEQVVDEFMKMGD